MRSSNRNERMAPHGYFRCAGSDEWVSIAVEDDGRWRALCAAIDRPEMAEDPRFSTLSARKENEDRLDAIVEGFTLPRDKQDVFQLLQNAGIAAGPVMNARDVLLDPHLAARGYFQRVSFPTRAGMPDLKFAKNPVVYGGVRPDLRLAAPDLGEHNRYILEGIMGFAGYEVDTMAEAEVIGTKPLADLDFSVTDVDEMDRSGAVAARDSDYREKIGLRLPPQTGSEPIPAAIRIEDGPDGGTR
jgi:crotonobetainyl-CoA:carnitine CoA-transferase CaiB-like acyl-CoA transferase